ncbi:MAG TPA: superoxide dismutase [Syntrophales bacterium]|nr:superoxide dismutase [Syntrophales bacterium]
MAIDHPPLPYPKEALAPVISAATLEFHWGKHHKAYVDNANRLLEGTPWAEAAPEAVMKATFGEAAHTAIFNNVAQAWNHTFYWHSLKPNGGGRPTGPVADLINAAWGSYDAFAEALKQAGIGQFGSGWAWLVLDGETLKVTRTPNAENPLVHGQKPLLTIDVWEHAYYLDYQNRRPDYLAAVIEKLLNWDFANANLGR